MAWLNPVSWWTWLRGSGEKKPNKDDVLKQEKEQLEKFVKELRANRVPLDVPWREGGEDYFSKQKQEELMKYINDFKMPDKCQNINLLMMGSINTGKSSFANTLKTAFRDNGNRADPAAVYGETHGSVTIQLHEVTLKTYENGKKLRLYDCRGIKPGDSSVFEEDLRKVIDGHVMKDYVFKDETISPENKKFRDNPTNSDKMHCVLFVTKATDDSKVPAILNNMKRYIGQKNIPIRLILTAMDKLDLYELKAVRSIFRSRDAKLKTESAKIKFGLQDHQILPIANYVKGMHQDICRDVLALQAVENILQEVLVYLEDNL